MRIEGNELADAEAKQAAAGNVSPPYTLPALLCSPLPISALAARHTHNEMFECAAAHLSKLKHYPCLRLIDASVPLLHFHKLTVDLMCKQANLLVQLHMRHMPLNQHLV